jgi:hypothetical protein
MKGILKGIVSAVVKGGGRTSGLDESTLYLGLIRIFEVFMH